MPTQDDTPNQRSLTSLSDVEQFLDDFFQVRQLDSDPAFSRFIPMVYDPIDFEWCDFFEHEFTQRFNGLMLRGHKDVGKVWCISFPTDQILDDILDQAKPGDLIFSHHPINMECGDPRGAKGRGFVPIDPGMLQRIESAQVSFYSCHIPLDIHTTISTSDAIVHVIGGEVIGQLLPVEPGYAGRLCMIPPSSLRDLIETCTRVLRLPYVDLVGEMTKDRITKVAVIAGGAGDVNFYAEADQLGADCLIAGEVTSKIDNEIGRKKQGEIERYLPTTTLSAVGLSHAGSEFLVMKEIAPFIEHRLAIPAESLPESRGWWCP